MFFVNSDFFFCQKKKMSYGGKKVRHVGFQVHQKPSKSARKGNGKKTQVSLVCFCLYDFHMKMENGDMMFSRGLRPRLWKRVCAGPMAHMSGNISSQHPKENPRCPLCNSLASLTRLGSGVPRPLHMRIRPGCSFNCRPIATATGKDGGPGGKFRAAGRRRHTPLPLSRTAKEGRLRRRREAQYRREGSGQMRSQSATHNNDNSSTPQ